jgi:hypothetical protein
MRRLSAAALTAFALAGVTGATVAATAVRAAVLVGGGEQARIARAFDATAAHRRQVIVSIRASTPDPAWSVVRSVTPQTGGRTTAGAAPITLHSSFYERAGGREIAAAPPAAVRADLVAPFSVAVVYKGSGSESIAYQQVYRSNCAGAGGYTTTLQDTVTPMSWDVRYVVNLDDLLAAVRSSQGTVLVPDATLDRAASTLSAAESVSQTAIDAGCNGTLSTQRCASTFSLSGPGLLSASTAAGLEVGIPMAATRTGTCDPNDYLLGPSQFDDGATTALVARLGLLGGTLPADPYTPVTVSWPGDSAALREGLLAGPCQGDDAACQDAMSWNGTVALAPAG